MNEKKAKRHRIHRTPLTCLRAEEAASTEQLHTWYAPLDARRAVTSNKIVTGNAGSGRTLARLARFTDSDTDHARRDSELLYTVTTSCTPRVLSTNYGRYDGCEYSMYLFSQMFHTYWLSCGEPA